MYRSLLCGLLIGCGSTAPVTLEQPDDVRGRIATSYDGPRIRVAVGPFEELEGAQKMFEELGWPGLGPMVTEQAVTALVQTGRVAVLERTQLGKVINNIKLESEDETAAYFDQETTKKAGSFEGAQAVLIGLVTDFQPNVSSNTTGISAPALASLTYHEDRAVVAVELRLVDQTTGRIIVAASGRGDVLEQEADAGVDWREVKFGTRGFSKTPIGQALREAVDDALLEMVERLPDIDWVGHIASVTGERVFIDGGADLNLKPGDLFSLFRRGDEVKDARGELIGYQETPLGSVVIRSVQAKMTVAEIVETKEPPRAGDLVRLPAE